MKTCRLVFRAALAVFFAGAMCCSTPALAQSPLSEPELHLAETTFVVRPDDSGLLTEVLLDDKRVALIYDLRFYYRIVGRDAEGLILLAWGGGECESYPVVLVGFSDGHGEVHEEDLHHACRTQWKVRETADGLVLERDALPWLGGAEWLLRRDGALVLQSASSYRFARDMDWSSLSDETAYDLLFIRSTNAALAEAMGPRFLWADIRLRRGGPGRWLDARFYVAWGERERSFVGLDRETRRAYYAEYPSCVGCAPRYYPDDADWPEALRRERDGHSVR